jgi:hypothetical protein
LQKKKAPLCSAAVQRDFAQNAGAAALVMAFVDEEGTDIVGATDYAGKMGCVWRAAGPADFVLEQTLASFASIKRWLVLQIHARMCEPRPHRLLAHHVQGCRLVCAKRAEKAAGLITLVIYSQGMMAAIWPLHECQHFASIDVQNVQHGRDLPAQRHAVPRVLCSGAVRSQGQDCEEHDSEA